MGSWTCEGLIQKSARVFPLEANRAWGSWLSLRGLALTGKYGCHQRGGLVEEGRALGLETLKCLQGSVFQMLVVLFGCLFKSFISFARPRQVSDFLLCLIGTSSVLCQSVPLTCRGNGQDSQWPLRSFCSWFCFMASSPRQPVGVSVGCQDLFLGGSRGLESWVSTGGCLGR